MKKITLLLTAVLLSLGSFAQMAQVWGTVKSEGFDDKEIRLYEIQDGKIIEISKTKLAKDGSFGFMINPPYEGFYAIGWGEFVRGKFPIYLKKGDKAEVAIDNRIIDFIGTQTPENTVLSKWAKMTEIFRYHAFHSMQQHTEFFPVLTALAAEAEVFKKSIKTRNTAFNENMKVIVGYDLDLYALNFMALPRGVFLKKEELAPYYTSIVDANKFNSDRVLGMVNGDRLLELYTRFAIKGQPSLEQKIALFNNKSIKGACVLQDYRFMTSIKNYSDFQNFTNKYGEYFQSPYQKEVVDSLGVKLYNKETGPKPALDFSYPDKNGKMVSLSDFKGKVVVIDVWATWCAPCIQQFPYLHKMEEAFKGKDVAFLSVSIDYEKDKQKWVTMLKEKNLIGTQLFAGGWTKITKDYAITTIPRFMVIAKDGTMVSADAPRPSDPKLTQMVNEQLAK